MTTEAKVGAFTLVGILLFGAAAVLLSGFSLGRTSGYTLYAGFHEVIGVTPQSVVRLSGVPVGAVKAIKNEGGGVMVTLSIQGDTKIPKGSHVAIGSTGVMGDKFINITPAKDNGIYLGDGDYLIGEDEAGMDNVFEGISRSLDRVQTILESMNEIVGNADFQKDVLQMAANVRETTAHLSSLVAAMEQTVRMNQGNVSQMLQNLNAATASMNRTMNDVEAMMANLKTVGADPRTAENLRATLANVKDASERIAHMAENMDQTFGDPKTAKDLQQTIQNARVMTGRAKGMMDELDAIEVKPSADMLYSGSAHDWRTNFNMDVEAEGGKFLRLGLEDIGDGDRGNVQLGMRRGRIGARAGVVAGDVGAGLDVYSGDRFRFSADAYDFDDMAVRLRSEYRLGSGDTWLVGEWDHVNDSKNRAAYFGVRQAF
ncbi:MAG: MlaD family protein [Mitsuokella sp.]